MLEVAKQLIGWDPGGKSRLKPGRKDECLGSALGPPRFRHQQLWASQIVNRGLPSRQLTRSELANSTSYGEVVVTVDLVRRDRATRLRQPRWSQTYSTFIPTWSRCAPVLIPSATCTRDSPAPMPVSLRFRIVGGPRRRAKLKSEMKRLGAFVTESKEEDIEFGVGSQGPELRSKSNGKSINYWSLANIVNVNSAVLPVEMNDVTLIAATSGGRPSKCPTRKGNMAT